jgi:cytidylate kinase
MYASAVSAIPAVREFLLETQRAIARKSDVIMDGRDIGTVILPDAEVKIFLTASSEARAKRRTMELNAKGNPITYAQVLAEMLERDENDSTRKTAPAVPADDAVFLDNSELTAEETVATALAIIQEKVKK